MKIKCVTVGIDRDSGTMGEALKGLNALVDKWCIAPERVINITVEHHPAIQDSVYYHLWYWD